MDYYFIDERLIVFNLRSSVSFGTILQMVTLFRSGGERPCPTSVATTRTTLDAIISKISKNRKEKCIHIVFKTEILSLSHENL